MHDNNVAFSKRFTFKSNSPTPLLKPYNDGEIYNAYFQAFDSVLKQEVLLSVYSSHKSKQTDNLIKKLTKFIQIDCGTFRKIKDIFLEDNKMYVSMQWEEGGTVTEYSGKTAFIDCKLAMKAILQASKAVEIIHSKGLTHSFISLQNLEISPRGVFVLSMKCLIHKTYYMSPESLQNSSKAKSKESDLFALGVAAYRLMTGVAPFKGNGKQYIDAVKKGINWDTNKDEVFPIIFPRIVQQIVSTLLNFDPQKRKNYAKMLQLFTSSNQIPPPPSSVLTSLPVSYIQMQPTQSLSNSYALTIACPGTKSLHTLTLIKSKLTEIDKYVEDNLKGWNGKGKTSVKEWWIEGKDALAIVGEYCNQGNLQEYVKALGRLPALTSEKLMKALHATLSTFPNPYRFLSPTTILIQNHNVLLAPSPFPTPALYANLAIAKQGISFLAPQIALGMQSKTADSWSMGVMELWVNKGQMPKWDSKGGLANTNIGKLSQLIERKHLQRKDIFKDREKIVINKEQIRQSSSSMGSSNQGLSRSKVKQAKDLANVNAMTIVRSKSRSPQKDTLKKKDFDPKDQKEDTYKDNKQSQNSPRKRFVTFQEQLSSPSSPIRKISTKTEDDLLASPGKNSGIQNTKSVAKNDENVSNPSKINRRTRGRTSNLNIEDLEAKNTGKTLNQKVQKQDKEKEKQDTYKNAFKSKEEEKNANDNKNKEKQKSKVKGNQQSKGGTLSKIASFFSTRPINWILSRGPSLAKANAHYSKPIRIAIKCIIFFILHLTLFYLPALINSGSLLASSSTFTEVDIPLRGTDMDTQIMLTFPALSRTPASTLSLLTNSTLLNVRDSICCVPRNYAMGNNSTDVLNVIQSSSFTAYTVFGLLFFISNLAILIISECKLDFPKCCSLIPYQDRILTPLYSWILTQLGLSSILSLTYLLYGDPCLTRAAIPSLYYLFKSNSSMFLLCYLPVYFGFVFAYLVIIWMMLRPTFTLNKWIYLTLLGLYVLGWIARSLSGYWSGFIGAVGIMGQILILIDIVIAYAIDSLFLCKIEEKASKRQQQEKEASQAAIREKDILDIIPIQGIQQYNQTEDNIK